MASILLIGFMGAGKTTIGKGLAQRLQKEYVDLDTKIEEHIQLSIAEYFHYYGENSFRKVESKVLRKLSNEDKIIATGGGIVQCAANRQFLQTQPIVLYLEAEADCLIDRIQQDKTSIRPLALGKTREEIKALLAQRLSWYEESVTLRINTTNETPEKIIDTIIERIKSI
ncbi:shikimate kinase [Enterococcus faecium]|uniref:shikimate kinase n=1 Tax=Enterococcus faecium TaxID=1352 RepID=UPI000FFB41A5|nr:shikimate kinase [Enterococcus faecium]MDV4862389.1 shikimate kinase [Enterococcus faecium]MDV4937949.1 shikimate kinase [Enterococcus faecium]RXD19543.1 shikimate kinase [Enterococcus faecium]